MFRDVEDVLRQGHVDVIDIDSKDLLSSTLIKPVEVALCASLAERTVLSGGDRMLSSSSVNGIFQPFL